MTDFLVRATRRELEARSIVAGTTFLARATAVFNSKCSHLLFGHVCRNEKTGRMRAVYASLILIFVAQHTRHVYQMTVVNVMCMTLWGTFPSETSRFNQRREKRQPHRHEERASLLDELDGGLFLVVGALKSVYALAVLGMRLPHRDLERTTARSASSPAKPALHIPLSLSAPSSVTSSSAMFAGMDGHSVWAKNSPLMVQHAKFNVH